MKRILIFFISALALLPGASAQQTWTLQQCLDYAVENNIRLQQSRNNYLSGIEDTEEAKAAFFPSLSASTSQGYTDKLFAENGSNSYTGSYGLNASMTLYNGGRLRNSLKKQQLQNSIDSLSTEESIREIKISIVQAYMQCLYAAEAVTVSESTVEASTAQRDRASEMCKTGLISKVDLAQLESQLYSDQYQVVVAKSNLDNYKLQLKQLLELGVGEEMILAGSNAGEDEVLGLLADKSTIYQNALAVMPSVQKGLLTIQSSELSTKLAAAGYYPSLSLSAGLGSGNLSGTGTSFGEQLKTNLNESVGLSLSIPIFSGRQNKTAVNKARIAYTNSRLEQLSTEKSLLKEVESTYLDAVSAQSQYVSAKEKEKYARQSYDLTAEQFDVGMKNTVELITAKNELLSATQSLLQAKYMALMDIKVLDIYQER